MVNFQQYDKCGELEMASIDCLEAYGTVRGAKKCADLLADFQECAFMTKQIARFRVCKQTFSFWRGLAIQVRVYFKWSIPNGAFFFLCSHRQCEWKDIVKDGTVSARAMDITHHRRVSMPTRECVSCEHIRSPGGTTTRGIRLFLVN